MTRFTLSLMLIAVVSLDAGGGSEPSARKIVEDFLQITPYEDREPVASSDSWISALGRLESEPTEAALAIAWYLPRVQDDEQRVDLLEILARLESPISAGLFISLLEDPDPRIRKTAVLGLRTLSSRMERRGLGDVPPEPVRSALVEGLRPYLAKALQDSDDSVRYLAMISLSETRDRAAIADLKPLLTSSDDRTRIAAAYFLSEFGDASGQQVIEAGIDSLIQLPADRPSMSRYFVAEQLVRASERLSGESLGEIPCQPAIYSNLEAGRQAARDYDDLLAAWHRYWTDHSD